MKKSAFVLALAGIIVFLGIQLAEANYTGDYSTARNYISDLGVDDSAAAAIFNISMMVAGVLIMIGAHQLRNDVSKKLWIVLGLYGLGTFSVGLFPGNITPLHGLFAGLLFITGPLSALFSRQYSSRAIKSTSTVLAVISILFIISFSIDHNPANVGGVERFVVYPITLWLIIFGSSYSTKKST